MNGKVEKGVIRLPNGQRGKEVDGGVNGMEMNKTRGGMRKQELHIIWGWGTPIIQIIAPS